VPEADDQAGHPLAIPSNRLRRVLAAVADDADARGAPQPRLDPGAAASRAEREGRRCPPGL
jgi:hypothetical protein